MAGMADMKNRKKMYCEKSLDMIHSGRDRRKLWITYFWDAMSVE